MTTYEIQTTGGQYIREQMRTADSAEAAARTLGDVARYIGHDDARILDQDGGDIVLVRGDARDDYGPGDVLAYARPVRTRCAYCHADVVDATDRPVAAVDDDAAWSKLAEEHADDCEWIMTRAHRR